MKRVCLELGGKSPLLIAEDADLAAAVRYGVQDVMINSGQTCTALTRMLLPASRYAEALEIALEETLSLRMGDPLDPQSFLGPMCSAGQRRTVAGLHPPRSVRRRAVAVRWRFGAGLRARPLRSPDAVRRRRQPHAHRPGRNLRPGAVPDSLCR